ncbi:hypothetical protein ACFO1B_18660 [Dactylosporangium siamense]|uniref:Uncharacterized protein n=1 Tax=Dactylosporangium siamense TaxID=685454 RepID=A0A919U604_9ACTN|nr:hypothetical protein [Dactylosporangium siamense]GIG43899.1 hypothetical protein Dsi01nite_019400 [Dactylosporangium siamense]
MDDRARAGLVGIGASVPIVASVWAFAADLSTMGGFGGLIVFLVYGPMIVLAAAAAGWVVVWALLDRGTEPWRHSWVIVAPFVMWVVLLAGAVTSGPVESVTEQRLGWALVVVLMYGAAGVGFGRGASRKVRVLASVLVVAAAPLMIAYDDASQYRWRKETYASAPRVLPVIPGYTVVAVRGEGRLLQVDMRGPADLWVSVLRCRDCTVRRDRTANTLTVVDGSFQVEIWAVGSPEWQWSAPDGIHVRATSIDELASLPLAVLDDAD